MQRFEAHDTSTAVVPAPRTAIWDVLRSPDELVALTPLLCDITVDGDRWTWTMGGFSALGVEIAPRFTERMTFEPEHEIRFEHAPPPGAHERAGAHGVYRLGDLGPDRTELSIDITLHVELPLPRATRRAVERVMASSMARTGDVFAQRLYRRLGIDEAAGHPVST